MKQFGGEVAQRLAHEIKNPLTPIQLSAEHIQSKMQRINLAPHEKDFVTRSTHTIVEQVKAMRQMVDEFSQYSGPTQSHFEVLSLNKIVSEVTDLYRASHAQLKLVMPNSDCYMIGAAARLRQLLHNLLKNAEEAMHDNKTGLITVTLAVDSQDTSKISLQIVDEGPGFAQTVIKNLFEPYATIKQKGRGLGLAIVKKIVEEHQGSIRAFNAASGGAIIALEFPRVES